MRKLVTGLATMALVISGWIIQSVPSALAARPPSSCTSANIAANVEAKDYDNIRKSQLHSYVWTPYGTGNECLRINSITMGDDNVDVYPYVEFGWKMGWSTCSGTPAYSRTPIAFIVWDSPMTDYQCRDTDSTGSRYSMDADTWEWFTLTTEGSGTGKWRATTAGPRTFRVTPYIAFSTGFPIFMNSERHCDYAATPNSCDTTFNRGNFDKIKIVQGGVSGPIPDPRIFPVPNDDQDFHQLENETTADGNHWQSVCDTNPCVNTYAYPL